jgi:hypothetical protein
VCVVKVVVFVVAVVDFDPSFVDADRCVALLPGARLDRRRLSLSGWAYRAVVFLRSLFLVAS